MRLVRVAAVGAAACALVGVVYGMGAASAAPATTQPAAASTAPTAPSGAGSTDAQRLHRLCTVRVPKVEDRLSKAVTRLTADATTKGSIAALEQRIARASAAGHAAEADLLRVLLDHRQQRLPMLRSTQQALDGWQRTYCTAS